MNVHHRCHKRVPNNCGLNTKDMATVLKEIGFTTSPGRKKVGKKFNVDGEMRSLCYLQGIRLVGKYSLEPPMFLIATMAKRVNTDL